MRRSDIQGEVAVLPSPWLPGIPGVGAPVPAVSAVDKLTMRKNLFLRLLCISSCFNVRKKTPSRKRVSPPAANAARPHADVPRDESSTSRDAPAKRAKSTAELAEASRAASAASMARREASSSTASKMASQGSRNVEHATSAGRSNRAAALRQSNWLNQPLPLECVLCRKAGRAECSLRPEVRRLRYSTPEIIYR